MGKGKGWHGDSAGHARAAKKRGGNPRSPAKSLSAAARQQRKLRAALRNKTIRHSRKTTTAKGRKRMKQRISANIGKYGAYKLSSYGGHIV